MRQASEPISRDEARRLYLDTATPARTIAARMQISEGAFRKLRARLGWPAREGRSGAAGHRPGRKGRRDVTTAGLVSRLRRHVSRRLAELDAVDAATPASEYAALMRVLNELRRLEASAGSRPEPARGGDDGPSSDLDAVREAIARRVESFGGGGCASGFPGDAAGA